MKKINILILILILSFLFSGCSSFKLASSIDDLITPVSPSGEAANVQSAMDDYSQYGYSLKIPAYGAYGSPYVYYDFDDDKAEEALVFYEPNDKLGKIEMAVLNKDENGQWAVIASVEGSGSDVYSVDFCDVNGDGKKEFLISWNVISNSTTHVLSIYRSYTDDNGDFMLKKAVGDITYSGYIAVDMTKDGLNELLVLTIDQTKSVTAYAKLYSIKGNKKKVIGETRVDGHVTGYKNLTIGKADGDVAVYADAIKSDGESMVTELIYWSKHYDSIISPFYSYSTGLTAQTTRKTMTGSCDINDDNDIEIPVDASLKKIPDGVRAVDWKVYKSSILVHRCYSIAVEDDGYQILIPDDDFKNISVSYEKEQKLLTVSTKDKNKKLFSVMTVLKSQYQENAAEYKAYEKILDKSGYVYLAKTYSDSKNSITIKQLKERMKNF